MWTWFKSYETLIQVQKGPKCSHTCVLHIQGSRVRPFWSHMRTKICRVRQNIFIGRTGAPDIKQVRLCGALFCFPTRVLWRRAPTLPDWLWPWHCFSVNAVPIRSQRLGLGPFEAFFYWSVTAILSINLSLILRFVSCHTCCKQRAHFAAGRDVCSVTNYKAGLSVCLPSAIISSII